MDERTPLDPRDLAVERALRRLFAPPAELPLPPSLAARRLGLAPAARPAPHAETLGGGAWGWRVVLATAAALAAILWLARDPEGERGERMPSSAGGTGALAHRAPGAPAGPASAPVAPARETRALAPAPPAQGGLERLYADLTREGAAMATCSGPDELNELRRDLAARCGQELILRPEAAGVLQGPYGTAAWPGGTVLTGFPDGPDGAPAVLVAECDGSGPASGWSEPSGLRTFVARVGSVVLTEITPLEQPRLLAYFEAR